MTRDNSKSGMRFGEWTIGKKLGQGGNGIVWRAQHSDGTVGALKALRNVEAKRPNQRFRDEVQAMRRCQDIPGVLPLLDFHLPDMPTSADPAWFVGALATPLDKADHELDLQQAVGICRSLAATLSAMHARGHSHRDIKPGNIFLYGDKWCLGDFGLVDFPEKGAVTKKGEKLGPQNYMAPEMLEDAQRADGLKADVYSLGKLLWKLATGYNYPLPGMHFRTVPALTISANVLGENTSALDALLEAMTQIEPDKRPTMDHVAAELNAWVAPPPAPTGPTDLKPFTKRAQALVDAHVVAQQRRASLQAIADQARDHAFAEFKATVIAIGTELQSANIGQVSIQGPEGGNAHYYQHVTGDKTTGISDRTWMFQYAVSVRIDGGTYRGYLNAGLNIGVRNVAGDTDTMHDIDAPVVAAVGHIIVLEDLFGGSWRTTSTLVWGEHDTFVLGQPREKEVLKRFASGLTKNLPRAVEALLAGMEDLKQPRRPLATFKVTIADKAFEVVVSEQKHLEGIAAARNRSDAHTKNDAEYIQFVLSTWAEQQTNVPTQQSLQEVLDRAVEDYYRKLVASEKK